MCVCVYVCSSCLTRTKELFGRDMKEAREPRLRRERRVYKEERRREERRAKEIQSTRDIRPHNSLLNIANCSADPLNLSGCLSARSKILSLSLFLSPLGAISGCLLATFVPARRGGARYLAYTLSINPATTHPFLRSMRDTDPASPLFGLSLEPS